MIGYRDWFNVNNTNQNSSFSSANSINNNLSSSMTNSTSDPAQHLQTLSDSGISQQHDNNSSQSSYSDSYSDESHHRTRANGSPYSITSTSYTDQSRSFSLSPLSSRSPTDSLTSFSSHSSTSFYSSYSLSPIPPKSPRNGQPRNLTPSPNSSRKLKYYHTSEHKHHRHPSSPPSASSPEYYQRRYHKNNPIQHQYQRTPSPCFSQNENNLSVLSPCELSGLSDEIDIANITNHSNLSPSCPETEKVQTEQLELFDSQQDSMFLSEVSSTSDLSGSLSLSLSLSSLDRPQHPEQYKSHLTEPSVSENSPKKQCSSDGKKVHVVQNKMLDSNESTLSGLSQLGELSELDHSRFSEATCNESLSSELTQSQFPAQLHEKKSTCIHLTEEEVTEESKDREDILDKSIQNASQVENETNHVEDTSDGDDKENKEIVKIVLISPPPQPRQNCPLPTPITTLSLSISPRQVSSLNSELLLQPISTSALSANSNSATSRGLSDSSEENSILNPAQAKQSTLQSNCNPGKQSMRSPLASLSLNHMNRSSKAGKIMKKNINININKSTNNMDYEVRPCSFSLRYIYMYPYLYC